MIKFEQNNEVITSSMAGAIGAAVKYAFNELTQVLGFAKYDNNATSLGTVMSGWDYSIFTWIFGFLTSLIIGAFFGVIFAMLFRYVLNSEKLLLKGAILGTGIWLLNFGIMSKIFNYPSDIGQSLGDVVSMLLSLIIFGIVTVYFLDRFGVIKENSH